MPKCPTCGKPVEWQDNSYRPFCSERCKLIDFSRWANEEYRVPGQKINPEATEQNGPNHVVENEQSNGEQ
ncbi:MAG TPA: DNA gyrase inhibitor YacG [Pyrinomonadaceae bacterium]|nr:DNA gyrase inhibitor YacG [Pyrinomonadaceae bacterium]